MSVLSAEQADRREAQGAPSAGAAQGHVEQELGQTPLSLDAKCSVASPWQLHGSEGPKQSPQGRGYPSSSAWLGLAALHAAARPPALQARGITASCPDAR